MAVRLILSVVVGLALSLSPAAYAMKQLELKSHSHIAAIDIPLSLAVRRKHGWRRSLR